VATVSISFHVLQPQGLIADYQLFELHALNESFNSGWGRTIKVNSRPVSGVYPIPMGLTLTWYLQCPRQFVILVGLFHLI
jgi:hypothetical protein